MKTPARILSLAVSLAVFTPAVAVQASGPRFDVVPHIEDGSDFALVSARGEEEIDQELESARKDRAAGAGLRLQAHEGKKRSETEIEIKRKEIEHLKALRKAADQAEDKPEKTRLEGEIKTQELRLRFLERVREMRESEIRCAEVFAKLAEADIEMLEKEKRVLSLSRELEGLRAEPEATRNLARVDRIQREVHDAEAEFLKASHKATEQGEDAYHKRREVLEKRVRILEAWREIGKK